MIVLDTNVVSELMRAAPDPTVFAWVDEQPWGTLYVTAIVEAEILSGIASLPDGRRQQGLAAAARDLFEQDFRDRILPFGRTAAACYAEVFAMRRVSGRPLAGFDGLIAAIALAAGATLATRNVSDFDGLGLALVNPWEVQTRAQ
jgi:predicted nucleic acid-binding protein